ncbi:MAG: WD40/YVTN/BNR-like repeat-containing protein [Candidatus Methylomirabilota bacterium]
MGGLPTNKTVYTFAASMTDPKMMFAGLREGAFKSTDGGESWRKLTTVPKDVAAIAIHPTSSEVVFLGTAPGKIFKSTDGGQTWRRQN